MSSVRLQYPYPESHTLQNKTLNLAISMSFLDRTPSHTYDIFTNFFSISTLNIIQLEHSTSAPKKRVWRITQLAKLSFTHPSVVLTADVFEKFTIHTRTTYELAHLSCVAQAFETCADELRPIAPAGENMCISYSSFWANWASSCSSYSSPWENSLQVTIETNLFFAELKHQAPN